MTLDQTFEVELGSDRSVGSDPHDPDAYEWVIAELGTMSLLSEEDGTHSEDPDEFVGGYSRYTLFTFSPTEVGSTQVVFHYVPSGNGVAEAAQTIAITVDVTG